MAVRNSVVIGGGWSVSQYYTRELYREAYVYGVNDSALWTNVHECVTMDRKWFENRWPYLRTAKVGATWVRVKCDCNVKRTDLSDNWRTFTHFSDPVPSAVLGTLHGGNSGACAINLALHNTARGGRIFLLGFDMCRGPNEEPYWYPPYPWAQAAGATKEGYFRRWAHEMDCVANFAKAVGVEIINVSMRSQITAFPKMEYARMREILRAG